MVTHLPVSLGLGGCEFGEISGLWTTVKGERCRDYRASVSAEAPIRASPEAATAAKGRWATAPAASSCSASAPAPSRAPASVIAGRAAAACTHTQQLVNYRMGWQISLQDGRCHYKIQASCAHGRRAGMWHRARVCRAIQAQQETRLPGADAHLVSKLMSAARGPTCRVCVRSWRSGHPRSRRRA